MRTVEDDLWIYFGYPNEFWRNKCTVCREKVGTLKVPVPECIDCWKVEIWSQSPWFVEEMVSAGYGSVMEVLIATALTITVVFPTRWRFLH